jgi:hypothetical protein
LSIFVFVLQGVLLFLIYVAGIRGMPLWVHRWQIRGGLLVTTSVGMVLCVTLMTQSLCGRTPGREDSMIQIIYWAPTPLVKWYNSECLFFFFFFLYFYYYF